MEAVLRRSMVYSHRLRADQVAPHLHAKRVLLLFRWMMKVMRMVVMLLIPVVLTLLMMLVLLERL